MEEKVGPVEGVILGCLLDKLDIAYPLTLAEYIADALRTARLLAEPSTNGSGHLE